MRNSNLESTPAIPKEVYDHLPPNIRTITEQFTDPRERDVVLTASFCVLSGCLSGLTGRYDRGMVGPSLFGFVVAPAGSGKGVAKYARLIGQPIHERLLAERNANRASYEEALARWKKGLDQAKREGKEYNVVPPVPPKTNVLFLPGNTSAAAIYQLLDGSNGRGIIFETEADSLSGSLKQEWGDFSDLLRKAFHHEPASLARKTEDPCLEILNPHLAAFLTGTPDQVVTLMQSAENGLFSRFAFYLFDPDLQWRDPTPCDACPDLTRLFLDFGETVADTAKWLSGGGCDFCLTKEQFERLNQRFRGKVDMLRQFDLKDAAGTVFRLGLICFRIAMILTAVRKFRGVETDRKLVCDDVDFDTGLAIVDIYFQHALQMQSMLPKGLKDVPEHRMSLFLQHLPDDAPFFRGRAVEIGKGFGIAERTVNDYLKKFKERGILVQISHGQYRKTDK